MGNDNTITGTFNGTIHLEYLPCINYAMIHNHVPSCNFCELMNSDEVDWNNIKVSIDGELIKYLRVFSKSFRTDRTFKSITWKYHLKVEN